MTKQMKKKYAPPIGRTRVFFKCGRKSQTALFFSHAFSSLHVRRRNQVCRKNGRPIGLKIDHRSSRSSSFEKKTYNMRARVTKRAGMGQEEGLLRKRFESWGRGEHTKQLDETKEKAVEVRRNLGIRVGPFVF